MSFLSPPTPQQLPAEANMAPKPSAGASATGNPRNKTALKPGRSLMDWIRLGQSGQDLTGVGGKMIRVTPEELAKHNTPQDAWTCVRGYVYNITAYMEFHPGGVDELMRGAGIDGTQLFDEVHRWVNVQSMLAKCLVGKLDSSPVSALPAAKNKTSPRTASSSSLLAKENTLKSLDNLRPPSGKPSPRYEWIQTENKVTVIIYTRWRHMKEENVIIDREGTKVSLTLLIDDYTYGLQLDLSHSVKEDYQVSVQSPSGKVELALHKMEAGKQWSSVGQPLNTSWKPTAETDVVYRPWQVSSVVDVTHDTKLYCLTPPEGTCLHVPLGHHVHARASIDGMDISRSYTAVPPSITSEATGPVESTQSSALHLMVKIYPEGALTPLIGKLQPGDELELSNPEGSFQISQLEAVNFLILCAAGTGFTPMAGLLKHTLHTQPDPARKVLLMFFNKEERDIAWQDQLDALAGNNSNFQVTYILSQPSSEWTGLTGRIRKDLLQEPIQQGKEKGRILFCACGPTPFTEEAVRIAKDLGCETDMIHAFLA